MPRLGYLSYFIVAATALASPANVSSQAAEPLQAGIAVVDITPPAGFRMSGYFSERFNTGTRDPLLAKAIVLRQGDVQAALVFCDISGISLEVSRNARQIAQRVTAIPAANIAVVATHSHTGPLYFGALRKHFRDRAIARTGSDPHESIDYPKELTGLLVQAILAAHQNLEPVTLAAGYAQENRLSFNRRFHMTDGTVRFNPGHLNPNVVRAAGPIDPEAGLISFTPARQVRSSVNSRSDPAAADRAEPSAALVVFALHLDTVGGTLYSADFPRYLQDDLRKKYGPDFLSLFGAGTCGDINHVDVSKPAAEGRRATEQIGSILAETVAARLPELKSIEAPLLAVRSRAVEAKLQSYGPEEVAAAKKTMANVQSRRVPFLDRVEAYKIMALELRGGDSVGLQVQVIRLSKQVAIVTLPGEVFVELGLAIKQASPFETTIVIELANDAPGYIPTRKAFAEGSYETVNSRVVPGSGERMVEAAVDLLGELASEKVGSTK